MAISIDGSNGITFPAGGVGNTAGAAVGTTDTQTLTNKTLTSPTISGTPTMSASVITAATSQASTSGTSIPFTGIPSWVERITIVFQGVSVSASADILIQLGTSAGYVTSGYLGGAETNSVSANSTAGLLVIARAAAGVLHGTATFVNVTGNNWAGSAVVARSDTVGVSRSAASISLAGTIDRVRVTTSSTDTFDAGTINILYE